MNRESHRYSKADLEFSPILNRMSSFTNDKRQEQDSFNYDSNCENPGKYSPFVIKQSPNLLGSSPRNSFTGEKYFFNSNSNSKSSSKIYTPSPNNYVKERLSDRFIPMNRGTNLLEKFELTRQETKDSRDNNKNDLQGNSKISANETYSNILEDNFFQRKLDFFTGESDTPMTKKDSGIKSKIFSFRTEGKRRWSAGVNFTPSLGVKDNSIKEEPTRKISNKPYKILEAPGLLDDFYLNLVDWSSQNNLAVGQRNSVYLWCANKTQCVKLLSYPGDKYVSSVIWNPSGDKVAVGNSEGTVEVWDVNHRKLTRVLQGHSARVGVVAWKEGVMSTGSKDYSILNRDLRSDEDYFSKFLSHKQEVCGLKWSFDGSQLASGGNDNKLMVWNLNSNLPVMKSSHHLAAVKAIAWSPHQSNLLASGGGTADRCIRFWNTSTYSMVDCIDTGSQVCNLVFSKTANEMVSTHGYSLNQIITWKLPTMKKVATLTGHTYRVLYLGLSPDGQNIVTGAGDQTLRFWNVFPAVKNNESSVLFPSTSDLR